MTDRSNLVLPVSQITGVSGTGTRFAMFNSDGTWSAMSTNMFAMSADTYTKTESNNMFKPFSYVPSFGDLTNRPNTLAGYGITDAYPSTNPNNYISSYSETDPIWLAQKASYLTNSIAAATYQPIGSYLTSETDPTWNSQKSNYSTTTQANALYKPIGYTPSPSEIANSLGYTPANPSSIPTNNNQLTNGSNFITAAQAPVQSVNGQTGAVVLSSNVYTNGFGISKTGTEPNVTFAINPADIMTVGNANAAIANMTNDINGRVPASRTITINNQSKQLNADVVFADVGIELPSQAGNSGRFLTTNGTSPSWAVSTVPAKVFNNNVARTFNSNYTISTTRDAFVTYSVNLSVTNPLLAGSSTASAFLEYSTDGGTNWTTVSQAVNSSSVSLTVTIQIAQPNTYVVSGAIPANALVRIRTTTSGTASATYVRGQEILD